MGFSVIVPVETNDLGWKDLIKDLSFLTCDDECLFVSPEDFKEDLFELVRRNKLSCQVEHLLSKKGRAIQQNVGARASKNSILWFIHCDSRIPKESFINLKRCLVADSISLYFFDLKFFENQKIMRLNEIGVHIRSRKFRLPFGDQAFCMSKETFKKLGGFDESLPFGEDHLLVWKAHQKKIKIKAAEASIYTSARRYQSYGWIKTTSLHFWLTLKQAAPQLYILLKMTIKKEKS